MDGLNKVWEVLLEDISLEQEIKKMKKELEEHYMRHSIIYMRPQEWDDIMYMSYSWQAKMKKIIDTEND